MQLAYAVQSPPTCVKSPKETALQGGKSGTKIENWMWKASLIEEKDKMMDGWDLDHIIPMASAASEEDVIRLNHHSNFQPLCSYMNRYVKKDKLS